MNFARIAPTLTAIALAAGVSAAHADGLRFLPGLDSGFKFEPTVALTGGIANAPAAKDDAVGIYGLEIGMNCGLLQTPDNRIRTQLQFNHVDQSGLKATSVELSPRYTLPLSGGFAFGLGPTLAWVNADRGLGSKDLFGYGASAGFSFRKGHYFSGLDLRYLNTADRNSNANFENVMLQAKVGYAF